MKLAKQLKNIFEEKTVNEETKLAKYDMVLKKLENKPAQKKAEFLEKALNDLVLKMLEKTTNLQDLKEWSNNFLLEVQGRAEEPAKTEPEKSNKIDYKDSVAGSLEANSIQYGSDVILEKSKIKAHVYDRSVKFWDLTFAGKKGKTVKSVSLDGWRTELPVSNIFNRIKDGMTIDEIEAIAKEMANEKEFSGMSVYTNVDKAIEHPTLDQKEFEFSNDKFYISSTPREFTLADKEDQANLPRVINRDKVSPKKLYDFLTSNPNAGLIKDYNFSQMWGLLDKLGVKGHHYYGMD